MYNLVHHEIFLSMVINHSSMENMVVHKRVLKSRMKLFPLLIHFYI